MKLHLKTTVLVSIITLAVVTALVLLVSARLAEVLRDEEKRRAELEATSLAAHYEHWTPEAEEAQKAAALVQETRLGRINIRVWKRSGEEFLQEVTTSPRNREMPMEAAVQLRHQQIARIEGGSVLEDSSFNYRVFAPIMHEGQVIGAVEVSDHLDTLPSVLMRFLGTAALLLLLAVGLIAATMYMLFRKLLYHPIEQVMATAQLQEHNEQLETTNMELWHTTRRLTQLERLAAAGQTAAQFAHEVGTPLNLISCHAQLLQAELAANPDAPSERTAIIIEQAERIERIVRQMMDRTRAETAEFAPLDLNALLKRMVEATALTLTARGVNLELSLAPALPPIEGDAEKLQQVFINLINNALDAMTEGGQLTITTRRETATNGSTSTSRVIATFVDTGCGMTPEVKAHIFDPLYTTKARSKGTGFGLVIAHQVMQEHRAQILVESAPQEGARFTLLFSALAAPSAKGQPA